ncbi:MAG: hypothetical protein KDN22_11245 [Verrucomicrobiae bacterium]|nr:hypothetical protein [Verrucomicrobiae bacterium]
MKKLKIALLLALCHGSQAIGADIHVPEDYPTLQDAVDAALSGDTIRIAGGVHSGQTVISSKDLKLIGKPGAILRATANMLPLPQSDGRHVPVLGIVSSTVTIKGLTFEGEHFADQYPDPEFGHFIGGYYLDSGGTVENCRFVGFREGRPGSEGAIALRMYNDFGGAPQREARVVGNTFVDNYDGVEIAGASGNRSFHMTIDNNVISGIGPSPHEYRGAGIIIGVGTEGTVSRNIISGYSCTDPDLPFPFAWGVLAFDSSFPDSRNALEPVHFDGNTFRDNQFHLTILEGDEHTIANNTFDGSAPEARPAAIWVSGRNVTISNNRFRDQQSGIHLLGDDPDYGDLLGRAIDAKINDNWFTEGFTKVTIQPGASGTETGSISPFPEPELTVQKAVLMSWFDSFDDYLLESSINLEGPWLPSEARSFRDENRNHFVFPTESAHRFFRLQKR